MNMLLHVALHDLRQQIAERSNIFFMFLMPMGFVAFFTLVNSGSGVQSDVQVSLPIVNHDEGILGSTFANYLQDESFNSPIHSPAEADTLDFGVRYLTIPAAFTDSVIAGVQTDVEFLKRERSNTDFDLTAEVRLHQAQVRLIGDLARWKATRDTMIAADPTSAAEQGRLIALSQEPINVTVQSEHAGRGRPVPTGTGQSIPGVMVMFVVMTVLIGGSASLTTEREQGTLRRLATTPLSARQIIAGKTLGLTFIGLVQAGILIAATELLRLVPALESDFRWLPHLAALVPLLIAYCACIATLTLFISGLLRTPQQAESLAWLMGMALSALGGAWWPAEIMPRAMRMIGQFFPTAWAMEGLHQVITWGHGFAGTLLPIGVLAAMSLIFWLVGARTMRVTV
jgi:ABC-2 type transport system permease protein